MVHLTSGTEYVVDMVSMDGVHKCVALWSMIVELSMGLGSYVWASASCDDEERVAALVEYEKRCWTLLVFSTDLVRRGQMAPR